MKPTSSQLRALEMFRILKKLPEDHEYVRASAVAQCLLEEGLNVTTSWFRQLDLFDSSIVDVQVLVVDDAFIDENGTHPNWDSVARGHGSTLDMYKEKPPVRVSPFDLIWIGSRSVPLLEKAVDALRAKLQQVELDVATPLSSPQLPSRRF